MSIEHFERVTADRDSWSHVVCALNSAKDVISLFAVNHTCAAATKAVSQHWMDSKRGAPLAADAEYPPPSQLCCGPQAAACEIVRRARLEDSAPLSLATLDISEGRDYRYLRAATIADGLLVTGCSDGSISAWDPYHHYPGHAAPDVIDHHRSSSDHEQLRGELRSMHAAGRFVAVGTDRGEVLCYSIKGKHCRLVARMQAAPARRDPYASRYGDSSDDDNDEAADPSACAGKGSCAGVALVGAVSGGASTVPFCVAAFTGDYVDTGETVTDQHGTRPLRKPANMSLKAWELPPEPGGEGFTQHMQALRRRLLPIDEATGEQIDPADLMLHDPMLLFRMMEEAQTPQETLFETPLNVRPLALTVVPATASCAPRRLALLSADQRVRLISLSARSEMRATLGAPVGASEADVGAASGDHYGGAISASASCVVASTWKRFVDVFAIAGRSDAAGQRAGDLELTSVRRIELASVAGSLSLVDGLALVDHESGRFAFTVVDPHSGSILKQQPRPKGDSPADAADSAGGAADARTPVVR